MTETKVSRQRQFCPSRSKGKSKESEILSLVLERLFDLNMLTEVSIDDMSKFKSLTRPHIKKIIDSF